jgi:hypothetical protein
MHNLGDPFLLYVVQRIWGVHSKTYEDDVRVGVTEWSKTIIIFLACRIPQGQFNVFAVYLHIRHIVLKNSWHIDLGWGNMVRTQSLSESKTGDHLGERSF